jgi:hypothetical protein
LLHHKDNLFILPLLGSFNYDYLNLSWQTLACCLFCLILVQLPIQFETKFIASKTLSLPSLLQDQASIYALFLPDIPKDHQCLIDSVQEEESIYCLDAFAKDYADLVYVVSIQANSFYGDLIQ